MTTSEEAEEERWGMKYKNSWLHEGILMTKKLTNSAVNKILWIRRIDAMKNEKYASNVAESTRITEPFTKPVCNAHD